MVSVLNIDLINVIGEFLGDCRYKLVFHDTPKTRELSQQIAVVPRENVHPTILKTFPCLKRKTIYRYLFYAAQIYYLPKLEVFYRVPMGSQRICTRSPNKCTRHHPHEFAYYYLRGAYPY